MVDGTVEADVHVDHRRGAHRHQARVHAQQIAIPVLALVGLVVSFVFPFAASVTLGVCFACGTGMTVYFWTRKSRLPAHSSGRTTTVR